MAQAHLQPAARSRAWRAIPAMVLLACATATIAAEPPPPAVDHHQHLLSPQGAALLNAPRVTDAVPAPVSALLQARESGWNDAGKLAALYAADAVALDSDDGVWLQGADAIAAHVSKRFARPYRIVPLAWQVAGDAGHLAALYSRGEGVERRNVGSVAMRLVRGGDGQWRIAMEYPVFPGPALETPLDADRLVALLDEAGMRRAVVLSVGYWFQAPDFAGAVADPARAAREENTWTADQAARHPQRLVAFCSLNPISDASLDVLAHCVRDGRFKGLKLHFGNSGVDLLNPEHVQRIRAVFAAANQAGLAMVVHARDEGDYGAAEARVFVEQLLPAAPDVVVQMAHLWGGANYSDAALEVYAEAVAARHPATARLIFDAADAGYAATTLEQGRLIARRMRQIGLDRIYYGSDGAFDGHPDPKASWQQFRTALPLTDAEFHAMALREAPYLRD